MNISLLTRKTTFTVLGLLTAGLLAGCTTPAMVPPETPNVVATGFNGPQGLLVMADGSLLVSDDGTGGSTAFTAPGRDVAPLPGSYGDTARVVKVAADGTQSVIVTLLSVSPPLIGPTGGGRLAMIGNTIYVTDGIWNASYSVPRPDRASSVLRMDTNATTEVANLFAFEAANNPDGVPAAQGGIDSHANGLAASCMSRTWAAMTCSRSLP